MRLNSLKKKWNQLVAVTFILTLFMCIPVSAGNLSSQDGEGSLSYVSVNKDRAVTQAKATSKTTVKKRGKLSAAKKAKIKKLISRFHTPVGFLGNPAMDVGEKPKGLTNSFITACSAFNVNQKYWKESNSDDEYGGYGEFIIKESYVKAAARKLFGKTCSVSALPNDKKGSYLLASRKGKNVVISGWSSPYKMYSKIKSISPRRAKTFDVRVDYYAKSSYDYSTEKSKKTMTVVYQVKAAPKSYYGYYVTGIRFI